MNQAKAQAPTRRVISERGIRIDGCPECDSQHGCERIEEIDDAWKIGKHREIMRWCADCGCEVD